MRTSTAVQLSETNPPGRVPFSVAAGIEDADENPTASGIELLKPVSVDVSAANLRQAEQLAEYLNALAEAELEAAEEGVEIGKRQSRRSVLKDALHNGLTRRIKLIEAQAGEPLPAAKDEKAMRAYARRVLAKAVKR